LTKTILAISIIGILLLSSTMVIPGVSAVGPPYGWTANPPHHIRNAATTSPTGLSPSQIYSAYGFNSLTCNLTATSWTDPLLCGHGQTIAIVDAYDDPTIANDLTTFSTKFGLPACTTTNGCFVKATPSGLPRSNSGWALEMALDVEWAHAIAPGAKIMLVEAKSNSFNDLFNAISYSTSQTGVKQVSMSWGGGEFSTESSSDSYFNKPGISFFASSGDSGTGTIYPSASPYVVAVGGTTLSFSGGISETAWSGSGGGISPYENEPSYQTNYQISNSNGKRAIPDVAYDADPNSGVSVYDSTSYSGQTGWFVVGGTSAGAPQWAAISAIINSGGGQLSSSLYGANPTLYNAATGSVYSVNYRDITYGTNGVCGSLCTASTGYDFVTGVGSPLNNKLIPYIQSPPSPDFTISASPSSLTINSGSSGSSTITVTSVNGFSGTVSLTSSPTSGVALSPSSVTVSSGGSATATLTLTPAASTIYTITGTASSISHSTNVAVTVNTVPSSIQNLAATGGNNQVSLTWQAPSDGGSPITGYNIYKGTSSGGESSLTTVSGSTLSYTNTALSNGVTYYYYVTAVNTIGESSHSNEVSATPTASPTVPSAIQNLAATGGNNQVSLTWSAPSNGGSAITGYDIYQGTTPGGEGLSPIATTSSTSYTVTGLASGTTYYYYVIAKNSVGSSSQSNEASATTLPATPTLSVSVTTDKASYPQKSNVYITVTVTSGTPIQNSSVTVTVKDPTGKLVQGSGTTNINGQIIFKYNVPPKGTVGTYSVSAQASATGYILGSGTTTFLVA
jgi:fibronectin type 3 domain-containing protein